MTTRPRPASSPRNLLVRLPGPLGDAVLATPALRSLRRALPEARITWVGRPAPLAALEGLPDRDAVMPLAGPFAKGLLAPLRAGRMGRRLEPDVVLLLAHSFASALAARASGAPRRVGAALHGRGLLLTEKVPLPRAGRGLLPRPMVAMYLDLVRALGAGEDDLRGPRLVASGFDRRRARGRLADLAGEGPLLAVNPGAAFGPAKVYPPARIAEVVARLRAEGPLRVLVLCGPGEERLAEETARGVAPPLLSTHGDPPDVGELKGLLLECTALLTTDSGPRHVAEALGVPTAVVMGPTDPRWTAGSRAAVVRKEGLACLGCHRRRCPIGQPCLADLDPRQVAGALLPLLLPAAPAGLPRGPGAGPLPG